MLFGCTVFRRYSTFTREEIPYKFRYSECNRDSNLIEMSPNGLYFGLVNDSIDFSARIKFDYHYAIFTSFGYGAYNVEGNLIVANIFGLGKCETFIFKVISKDHIQLLDDKGRNLVKDYRFYRFPYPINEPKNEMFSRLKISSYDLRDYPNMWVSDEDYAKFQKRKLDK